MLLIMAIISTTNWAGIYLGENKIGYTYTRIEKERKGYKVEEITKLQLTMMGEKRGMKTVSSYKLDRKYRLISFTFNLESKGQKISSSGRVLRQKLAVTIKTGGTERKVTLPFKGNLYAPSSIPLVMAKTKKRMMNFNIFDPTLSNITTAKSIIKQTNGDSLQIETTMLSSISTAWIDRNGNLLRENSPMGVVTIKESEKEALKFGEIEPEILTLYAIKAGVNIKNPRQIKYMRAVVDGRFLDTQRQKRIGDTLIVQSIGPLKGGGKIKGFIEDTPLIQVKDKRIKSLADSITGNDKDQWNKVKRLVDWVSSEVRDVPVASIPSALDVLKSREGDCNEHSVLFAALSRASGIPTDICVGVTLMGDHFYYHAWNKVWVGRWVEVDPTFGEYIADATHITLAQGGLMEWAKIMDLVGNIKIKVVEYKK